jgi:hypothetical protein
MLDELKVRWRVVRHRLKRWGDKSDSVIHPGVQVALVAILIAITAATVVYAMSASR